MASRQSDREGSRLLKKLDLSTRGESARPEPVGSLPHHLQRFREPVPAEDPIVRQIPRAPRVVSARARFAGPGELVSQRSEKHREGGEPAKCPFAIERVRRAKRSEARGFFSPISRNANKDWPISRKPRDTNNLAFSSCCVGFRPFASIFVLCQHNDTRNDTRRNRLGESLGRSRQRDPSLSIVLTVHRPSDKLESLYANGFWESRRRAR